VSHYKSNVRDQVFNLFEVFGLDRSDIVDPWYEFLVVAAGDRRVKTQTALAADKQARVSALSGALSRRVAWDRVFRELSLVLPNDVWLATISGKAPVPSSSAVAPAPAAAGATIAATGFTIDGYTYSHPAVARLLSRLAVVPDLVNVQLQQSTLTKVGTAQAVHFVIVADVRRPGGGQ